MKPNSIIVVFRIVYFKQGIWFVMILSTFKRIYSILDKKQKKDFFVLVAIMFIASIFESFSLSLLIPAVSLILDDSIALDNETLKTILSCFNLNDRKQFILLFIVILLIMYFLKNLFLYFQCNVQNNYVYNNRAKFFQKIYSEYLCKDYSFFIKNQSGDIVRTIYNDVFNFFSALSSFITIITQLLLLSVMLIMLLFIQPFITILASALLIVQALIINFILEPKLVKKGRVNNENVGKFYSNIIQTIECIKEIKVFNKEDYFIKKTNNLSKSVSETDKKYTIFATIPKLFFETFTVCAIIIILGILVYIDYDVKNILPILSVFGVATIRFLPAINLISASINNISYYKTNVDNVINLAHENMFFSKEDYKIIESDTNNSIEFKRFIYVKDLTFSYNSNALIFDKTSITIEKNSCIGIIGKSGVGKSTFVDLLLGLIKPNSGKILCDEVCIEDNYNEWLKLIGYIPQNTCLINDSILKNIAFGINENDMDIGKVEQAIKDSQLADLIKKLPNGINTNIGERGVLLSGGQRQRIGIARAIYNDPKILIFDEATSALDNKTEEDVINAINSFKNKKTMIIIAHRLTTLKSCDKVYKIENKRLVEAEI